MLAAPLRKLPTLEELGLCRCEIGDKDVASLVANLGKDDFKALQLLCLDGNNITDAGYSTIVKAIDGCGMLSLVELHLEANPASAAACQAVKDAAARRGINVVLQ